MYAHMHTYIHRYMYACICMHICMYVYVCVCMCVCMCVYVCVYVCICVYAYIYMYVCIIYGGIVRGELSGGIVQGGKCPGELSYTRITRQSTAWTSTFYSA